MPPEAAFPPRPRFLSCSLHHMRGQEYRLCHARGIGYPLAGDVERRTMIDGSPNDGEAEGDVDPADSE